MNEPVESDRTHRSAARGTLPGSLAALTAVLLVVFVALASDAAARHGQIGLIASGIAAGVCWLAGSAALCCVAFTQQRAPLQGLLASMVFRMGLPLVIGLTLQQVNPELARVGIFRMVLYYYLVTLTVETLLSVRLIRFPLQVSKAS